MYESERKFQNFDELIYSYDQLNTFLHASREECLKKLNEQYSFCHTISIINLKKKKQVFEIQNRRLLSTIHPLAQKYTLVQTECFSFKDSLQLFEKSLIDWKIDVSNIDYFNVAKSYTNYSLTISHLSHWEDFELNHLRYYCFLIEIEKLFVPITKCIISYNLADVNQNVLMELYQKMKFEINSLNYELLKEYDLGIQDCRLQIKSEYNRMDYLITNLIFLEKAQVKIDKRYENCIAKSFDISSTWMKENLSKLNDNIALIESTLRKAIFSRELKNCVLNVFTAFKERSFKSDVSFEHYNYMKIFTSQLENFLQSFSHINQATALKFIGFLIEMNFNDFNFLQCLADDFHMEVDKIKDEKTKVRFLITQNLKYDNFPIRVRSMFIDSSIDLKSQIKLIIENELKYVTRPVVEKSENSESKTAPVKIKLKKNASSLILLMKTLNDLNFFENASATDISRCISANFSTETKEELTLKSVRNRYYFNDPHAKQELVIILQNIITELKKN